MDAKAHAQKLPSSRVESERCLHRAQLRHTQKCFFNLFYSLVHFIWIIYFRNLASLRDKALVNAHVSESNNCNNCNNCNYLTSKHFNKA